MSSWGHLRWERQGMVEGCTKREVVVVSSEVEFRTRTGPFLVSQRHYYSLCSDHSSLRRDYQKV